jgi:3-dehydroquinate synthase
MEKGPNKYSTIISVGGGVVNNLCGVLAGMIYRGIGLVHFTTTTMGMLDAALDFKQAINHQQGKNLLGCYHPASTIVIDPDCTSSLSTRHTLNGIAEALKHAICQSEDMLKAIVEPVIRDGPTAIHDGSYIEDICKYSIEIKVPTLDHYHDSDFNEMCPQYGHAVGHAVEYLSWKARSEPLLHGEAVCIGMCVSAEIAFMRGLCDQSVVDRHYSSVTNVGLPAFISESLPTEAILSKMTYDKHFIKMPSMGLCARIGEMAMDENKSFAFQVTNDELRSAMQLNKAKAFSSKNPPIMGSVAETIQDKAFYPVCVPCPISTV